MCAQKLAPVHGGSLIEEFADESQSVPRAFRRCTTPPYQRIVLLLLIQTRSLLQHVRMGIQRTMHLQKMNWRTGWSERCGRA